MLRGLVLCLSALLATLLALESYGVAAEAPTLPKSESEWVVRSWQTEDGLPQNNVNALVQTRDGFLWVGTSGGLARFDGTRFRTLGLHDGLRAVRISSFAEDSKGGLWIGTTGGGVSRWENGGIRSFPGELEFPAGSDVICMAADRDGSLWVGTQAGLVKWSGGKFSAIGEAEGLPKKQIRALAIDVEGTLWVSVLTDGIYRNSHGRFTRAEGDGPKGAYSLLADRDGSLWAGDGNGWLWHWNQGAWERLDKTRGLPFSSFYGLAQGKDGTIWVCSRSHGLYRSRGAQFIPATGPGDLSDENTTVASVDREGSIWVGTSAGGLNRLSPRILRLHGPGTALESNSVTSIAEDDSGAWWTTTNGGIYRLENGRPVKVEAPASLSHYPYGYATVATQDGAIWTAGEQCLFRFHAAEPTQEFLESPVKGEAIRALCPDGESLWLGTYHSTLLRADKTGVRVMAPPGTFRGDITSIAREAADTLWIGSAGGLHRWEKGQIRSWDTRDGLSTASIRALLRDPDGTLWLGTFGGGLARFKDGRFFNITTRQGLIDDVISAVIADDLGFLWLGCNRGIMRIDRKEIDALVAGKISALNPIIFQRNEGLVKEQCAGGHSPTALKTRDGRLLFPTVAGIAEIDPRQLQNFAPSPPKATIEDLHVDDQPCPVDQALVISPGKHRVDIRFTAPVLRGGDWTRFRYQMKGLDADWVLATGERLARYEGLRPGNYEFHIQASDAYGDWIESGARVVLTQKPFVWQTPWFGAAVAILLLSIGGGAAWWHTHRKHRREVEELERTQQLQADLAHVSRVSLLGELSASFAHELNQPLTAILSNAQAGLRFLESDSADLSEVRAILNDISTADRRASKIIERMRALMKKGKTTMEEGDINADVSEVLLLLRGDLAKRAISITTRLDENIPLVKGDHIQVQQVILNLIVNGCDAMKDVPAEQRNLLITTRIDGEKHIGVSVADEGTGIPPESLKTIFEAFYTTKPNGLGMGLAICHAIIQAHKGRLWVTNNSGSGATFHFTLPIADSSSSAPSR